MKVYIAEFFATFQFILIGTSAVVYANETQQIGQFEIGMAFGLSVYIGVLLFSRINGAHLNPSISILAWLLGLISFKRAATLTVIQLFAAICASLLVKQFAAPDSTLGITQPQWDVAHAWGLEFFMTTLLLVFIFLVHRKSYLTIGLVTGGFFFLCVWLCGEYTGASLNAVRSIGPAVVSGNFNHLWIYITASLAPCLPLYLLLKPFMPKN